MGSEAASGAKVLKREGRLWNARKAIHTENERASRKAFNFPAVGGIPKNGHRGRRYLYALETRMLNTCVAGKLAGEAT